jgi:hypothetical protein
LGEQLRAAVVRPDTHLTLSSVTLMGISTTTTHSVIGTNIFKLQAHPANTSLLGQDLLSALQTSSVATSAGPAYPTSSTHPEIHIVNHTVVQMWGDNEGCNIVRKRVRNRYISCPTKTPRTSRWAMCNPINQSNLRSIYCAPPWSSHTGAGIFQPFGVPLFPTNQHIVSQE